MARSYIRAIKRNVLHMRLKNIILFVAVSAVILVGYRVFSEEQVLLLKRLPTAQPGQHRLVHLDLKGAPPRVSYFNQLFPLLYDLGATGLLIEWEDTFPYWGDLKVLAAKNAYSKSDVENLLKLARKHSLEVVPLVQTFGHLEFVLKHEQFRSFRERDRFPNVLCPSNPGSLKLVQNMITQIMEIHKDTKYIHIGSDEVWHLGDCNRCRQRMESKDLDPTGLFFDHVSSVAKFVKENYGGVNVIMWDDMFRKVPLNYIKSSGLGDYVEPMIWYYKMSFAPNDVPPTLLEKYYSLFSNVWAASSFKGATGPRQIVTDVHHHIQNHLSWLRFIHSNNKTQKQFRGFALTGWQRYDHYAVLCELLPEAIPSLGSCLSTLQKGIFDHEQHVAVARKLGFDMPFDFHPPSRSGEVHGELTFPGCDVYTDVITTAKLKREFQALSHSDILLGWYNEYQIKRNFTNPYWMQQCQSIIRRILIGFENYHGKLLRSLSEVYADGTVEEWMETHFMPEFRELQKMAQAAKTQLAISPSTIR